MTRTTRPNERLVNAGDKLIRYTATQYTQTIDMLTDRIAHAHYPNGTDNEPVHTSAIGDPTSSSGLARSAYNDELDMLVMAHHDAIHVLDQLAHRCERLQRWANPCTPAEELKLCKHGQQGRDGVLQWGDPLCDRLPDKLGMCSRDYMRYYRWCAEHGVDRTKDFAA